MCPCAESSLTNLISGALMLILSIIRSPCILYGGKLMIVYFSNEDRCKEEMY